MKINWKVRLKNPTFWITSAPAIITFVYSILALFGVVPSITKDVVMNVYFAVVAILVEFGVVVDPTTKGIGDSDRAMNYDKPGGGAEDVDV